MSIYTEIIDESGVNPSAVYRIMDGYLGSSMPAWNLPKIDILEIWGDMSLRAAVGLLTGGDTPTTYSRRMADAIRELTGPSLLGLDEDPVDVAFTQAMDVIQSLRRETVDAEVIDGELEEIQLLR